MKTIGLVSFCFLLGLSQFTSAAIAGEWDDSSAPSDARFVIHLTTDATTITCDIYTTVDGSNALTGLGYSCSNNPSQFKRYTLDDLHSGIVFSKADELFAAESDINLATISGPDVTATGGGDIDLHYISNGITGSYADYDFTLDPYAGAWATYTSQDAGGDRFDQLFLKKKTSLGATIGVQCVSVSLAPTEPAASCQ